MKANKLRMKQRAATASKPRAMKGKNQKPRKNVNSLRSPKGLSGALVATSNVYEWGILESS
jgi:hypothetical protein